MLPPTQWTDDDNIIKTAQGCSPWHFLGWPMSSSGLHSPDDDDMLIDKKKKYIIYRCLHGDLVTAKVGDASIAHGSTDDEVARREAGPGSSRLAQTATTWSPDLCFRSGRGYRRSGTLAAARASSCCPAIWRQKD